MVYNKTNYFVKNNFSRTLDTKHSCDMGLQLFALDFSPDLYIGVIRWTPIPQEDAFVKMLKERGDVQWSKMRQEQYRHPVQKY